MLYKADHTFNEDYEAEAWLGKAQKQIAAEVWVSPREIKAEEVRSSLTVGQLVDMWLKNSNGIKKDSTRQSHKNKLNLRVLCDDIPGKFHSLKDLPIVEMTPKRAKQWWDEVKKVWPETEDTNATAYVRLHTAFQYAVEQELLDVNPVNIKGAGKRPKSKVRTRDLVTVEEAKILADSIDDRLKAGAQLLFWAGLRIGELLELRRKDILTVNGVVVVHVQRNAQRVKDPVTKKITMLSLPTPKTSAGERKVTLPPTIGKAVLEHLNTYVDDDDPEALLFTTTRGSRYMDTHFRNRFKLAAKAAGRPDITPHDMRRAYGTMLVNPVKDDNGNVIAPAPASLEAARQLMGHETTEQVLEYQRAGSGFEHAAATTLEKLMQ